MRCAPEAKTSKLSCCWLLGEAALGEAELQTENRNVLYPLCSARRRIGNSRVSARNCNYSNHCKAPSRRGKGKCETLKGRRVLLHGVAPQVPVGGEGLLSSNRATSERIIGIATIAGKNRCCMAAMLLLRRSIALSCLSDKPFVRLAGPLLRDVCGSASTLDADRRAISLIMYNSPGQDWAPVHTWDVVAASGVGFEGHRSDRNLE